MRLSKLEEQVDLVQATLDEKSQDKESDRSENDFEVIETLLPIKDNESLEKINDFLKYPLKQRELVRYDNFEVYLVFNVLLIF